tara:strand:- start:1554 stop:2270 length:717 start_codon:yes stop_codon:yes gene_type:complete
MGGDALNELVILLPARDEEDGIGEVIDRIPTDEINSLGYSPRIVVADGKSSDSTREIAVSKGAEVVIQNGSIGKGNGVREALQEIYNDHDNAEDLLIMLDADATYFPEDLPRFVAELQDSDVVWGSRLRGQIENGAMSSTNKLGNRLLSLAASVLFFKRTTDLCTGYWGFKSDIIKNLALTAEGFNLEADLFGSIVKKKSKEIPINYALREGHSNLRWYADGPRIMLMIIRKRLFGKA